MHQSAVDFLDHDVIRMIKVIVRIFRFSLLVVLIFKSGPLCIFHHLYKLLSTASRACQLVISTQKMYQKELAIVSRPQERMCSL